MEGIASYEGVGNITIQNNIIQNTSYSGLDLYNYTNSGGATSDNVISHNLIRNLGGGGFGWGIGILVYNNFFATIEDNEIDNVRVGIQTGNYYQPNPGEAASISNNQIATRRLGIFYNLAYTNASAFTISGNTITADAPAADESLTHWDGILLSSQSAAALPAITGNNIDGSGTTLLRSGYNVWNTTTPGLTISGGSVSNVDYGVFVNNFEGYSSNANNTAATVSGVSISADQIGVYVLDSGDNTNGATVFATITDDTEITTSPTGTGIKVSGTDASADILSNDASIHGNLVGVDVDGGNATVTSNHIYDNATGIRFANGGTGSVTSNTFSGTTDNGTDLFIASDAGTVTIGANNAFAGDTFYIDDQSTQDYDLSSNGTTFDESDNFRIEDKIHHRMDTDLAVTNGLVTWVADHRYVTTPGGLSTDSDMQRAIAAAKRGQHHRGGSRHLYGRSADRGRQEPDDHRCRHGQLGVHEELRHGHLRRWPGLVAGTGRSEPRLELCGFRRQRAVDLSGDSQQGCRRH